MTELDIAKVTSMLTEAVEHANKFLEAPKMKEYSFKVAAQDLLRKTRQMITTYNLAITEEYRKRKSETPKKEAKPAPSKQAKPSPSKAAESVDAPAASEEETAEAEE